MNKDILLTVFTFLKPEEACKINLTSKMFLEVYRDHYLWKLYCEKYMTGEEISELCRNGDYFDCYNIWFDVKNFMKKLKGIGRIRTDEAWSIKAVSKCNVLDMIDAVLLDCNDGKLGKIPREIYRLQKLTFVSFSNNDLTELPEELFQLGNLIFLSLNNNNLTEIPGAIEKLTRLKRIFMDNNEIRYIPDILTKMVRLEYLCLDNNQIECIPDNITKLANLRDLFLRNNNIKILPENIYNITCFIYLDDNKIENISDEFLEYLLKSKITTTGNPFIEKLKS